jgi:phosphate:Na+ symporter
MAASSSGSPPISHASSKWLVPDKPLEEEALIVRTKFLQAELLTTPSLALDSVRMEVMHMGETVNTMFKGIMPAIIKGDRKALEEHTPDGRHG